MISTGKKPVRKQRKVPSHLIYKMMDGKPIYYKGYQAVLNKSKELEDFTGSSTLQNIILNFILTLLHKDINDEDYWILINEDGIHLDYGNNLAGDSIME